MGSPECGKLYEWLLEKEDESLLSLSLSTSPSGLLCSLKLRRLRIALLIVFAIDCQDWLPAGRISQENPQYTGVVSIFFSIIPYTHPKL